MTMRTSYFYLDLSYSDVNGTQFQKLKIEKLVFKVMATILIVSYLYLKKFFSQTRFFGQT